MSWWYSNDNLDKPVETSEFLEKKMDTKKLGMRHVDSFWDIVKS